MPSGGWIGPTNLALASVALASLIAVVAVMATVPVQRWEVGTLDWNVHYEPCVADLCPIQEGLVNLPNGSTVYLHWVQTGAPTPVQFWVTTAGGRAVYYSNTTGPSFTYTTVDAPYELVLGVPHPLSGDTVLELNYSFTESSLLL